MAFLPAISGWAREPAGPSVHLHMYKSGRNLDRRRLTFVLSREVIEQVGWQGGERVVLALGVGDDLGSFQISRITKPRDGLKLIPRPHARGFRVSVTLPPGIHGVRPADFLDLLALPAPLDFAVREGALELRCRAGEAFRAANIPLNGIKTGATHAY